MAGDTAWAPRCGAGRTAGSAGPRRRNTQLRWAMRGQDPPDTGSMKYALIPLLPFAAFLIIGLFGHWIRERAHWIAVPAVGISFLLSAWIFTEVAKGEPIHVTLYSWIASGTFDVRDRKSTRLNSSH